MAHLITELASRRPLAQDIDELVFNMLEPEALAFKAGQFVTLAVGTDPEGHAVRRSYSLASPSDDGASLRFIVRMIDGGAATEYFRVLALGSRVDMTGPHGFFVLDPAERAGALVFAATGTGLAPVMSMLDELAARPKSDRRPIHVFWGLRSEGDVFSREEVQSLCARAGAQLRIHVSRPTPAWPGERGRITPAVLELLPALERPIFYLVGNSAMIDELKKELIARGVDRRRQVRTESFF